MKIAFPCESCGHRFEVDGSPGGQEVQVQAVRPRLPDPRPPAAVAGDRRHRQDVRRSGALPGPRRRRPAPAAAAGVRPLLRRRRRPATRVDRTPGSRDPLAHEDEEFLPPRGRSPSPRSRPSGKRKRRGPTSSAIDAAPWWVVKVGGGLTLASALCCLFSVQIGLVLVAVFYFGTALILLAMGGIGMTVVPFLESAACGLMNLFVPVYPIYYLVTRWDDMKRWFLTYLAGFLLFIPGLFFAVGIPVVETVRDAARGRRSCGPRSTPPARTTRAGPSARPRPRGWRRSSKANARVSEAVPPAHAGSDPPVDARPGSPPVRRSRRTSAPKFPEPPGYDVPSGSPPLVPRPRRPPARRRRTALTTPRRRRHRPPHPRPGAASPHPAVRSELRCRIAEQPPGSRGAGPPQGFAEDN